MIIKTITNKSVIILGIIGIMVLVYTLDISDTCLIYYKHVKRSHDFWIAFVMFFIRMI